MVLNFQFVQIFHEQNWLYKSVRNMTQKVVHKMGVGNDKIICDKIFFSLKLSFYEEKNVNIY